ncbi:serine/threonine-protein kinase [Streptomyces sp. NPDC090022]|uniref:serine/threonine-protein kinase n=1 Tax=Streptomyces sp. NPDC090022 TaxID=3365920 RepID=UPI0037F2A27D
MSEDPERVVAGRYRLLDEVGRGGSSIVWRARDEVLGREVAVKEVRAPDGPDPSRVRRMYARREREAWAAARIAHDAVVAVHDVVSEDGRPWIVMELVRGLSLADVLAADGPVSPREAAGIGVQVLAALSAAQGAGVPHRGVGPGTVLIGNDGRVHVSGFGSGQPDSLAPDDATPDDVTPDDVTPDDEGPDLRALGVLLYTAVEGIPPVPPDAPRPRRAGALAPVLEGLLREDPAARMTAARAAELLRVVAAGGSPPGAGGPAADRTAADRTAADRTAPERDGAKSPAAGGSRGPAPQPTPEQEPDREPAPGSGSRRAGAVLTIGVLALVALLTALAVLGWRLLD